jgi:hypothetical protein
MSDNDDFTVFDQSSDVEVRTPSLARVLLTLAGAGVLVAIVVVVLATLATAGRPAAATLCNGQSACSDLTVDQVSGLTALTLPPESEVLESRYESTAQRILVEATVRLPFGSDNPFEASTYFVVDKTPLTLPTDTEPYGYYAATGEAGSLVADGALVDDGQHEFVVVRVVRTL